MESEDIHAAVTEAALEAQATFKDANKSPIDHGHAFVKGVDGRTKLARVMKEHDMVDVTSDNYHGTVVYVNGLSRYLTAQRGAYDVFLKTLRAQGVDTSDMYVWTHGH